MNNQFFWHDNKGNKKYHWINTGYLYKPKEEGELGMRKFSDIVKAFSYKMWWRFREGNSLCAKFLTAKYRNDQHSLNAHGPSHCSKIWKRMLNIRNEAEVYIS